MATSDFIRANWVFLVGGVSADIHVGLWAKLFHLAFSRRGLRAALACRWGNGAAFTTIRTTLRRITMVWVRCAYDRFAVRRLSFWVDVALRGPVLADGLPVPNWIALIFVIYALRFDGSGDDVPAECRFCHGPLVRGPRAGKALSLVRRMGLQRVGDLPVYS